ncbi:alkyl hydroperoxide reductase AhpD [Dyadobacter beijingensis]|uniref:Alkyl hydroperoxide reductase AhpD n=1 Tax=Dyadobacter beijingensis TaxID=365489 RepID=A0ABQ2HRP6_9BACT|nr:carboxymuconolactone decarboxylase family protein [Dyadobacter beijingensis]GGM89710.1 alkyl hydroperoxide reductase AhpD [Dyadobacter beijingensis]
MKTISVPAREQVNPQSQELFDALTKRLGRVPNLYATIGYSHAALKMMLDAEETLGHGKFSAKEREAVYLVVSQVNQCEYCLAAHTILATKRGYSQEETILFRKGFASDPKLQTAIQLAKSIAENKGDADETLKEAFFDAGYDEAALMDLIGLVTIRTFTNYVFVMSKIPVDFPAAEKI